MKDHLNQLSGAVARTAVSIKKATRLWKSKLAYWNNLTQQNNGWQNFLKFSGVFLRSRFPSCSEARLPLSPRSHRKNSLFPRERRRHTVSFLSLFPCTSRTARWIPKIPALLRAAAKSEQSAEKTVPARWLGFNETFFPYFKDSYNYLEIAAGANCEPKQKVTDSSHSFMSFDTEFVCSISYADHVSHL